MALLLRAARQAEIILTHPNTGASPRASTGIPTTNKQRRAAIWARCEQLLQGMPPDFSDWSPERANAFTQDCMTLQRTVITSSLFKFIQAAERVATAYGVTMAEIDPCHGSQA